MTSGSHCAVREGHSRAWVITRSYRNGVFFFHILYSSLITRSSTASSNVSTNDNSLQIQRETSSDNHKIKLSALKERTSLSRWKTHRRPHYYLHRLCHPFYPIFVTFCWMKRNEHSFIRKNNRPRKGAKQKFLALFVVFVHSTLFVRSAIDRQHSNFRLVFILMTIN